MTADVLDQNEQELRARLVKLESRVQQLVAIVRLLMVLVRVSSARLDGKRMQKGGQNVALADAVSRASRALPLRLALRVLGLTPAGPCKPCPLEPRAVVQRLRYPRWPSGAAGK